MAAALTGSWKKGDYTKAGVSGFTTNDIFTLMLQMESELAEAEIITLNISANNLLPLGVWFHQGMDLEEETAWLAAYPGMELDMPTLATLINLSKKTSIR